MRKIDLLVKKFYSSENIGEISSSKKIFKNEKFQTISKKEIRKHIKYFALICISVFLVGYNHELLEFILIFWVFLFIYNLQK